MQYKHYAEDKLYLPAIPEDPMFKYDQSIVQSSIQIPFLNSVGGPERLAERYGGHVISEGKF